MWLISLKAKGLPKIIGIVITAIKVYQTLCIHYRSKYIFSNLNINCNLNRHAKWLFKTITCIFKASIYIIGKHNVPNIRTKSIPTNITSGMYKFFCS